jgi:uncharacterized C2H2 Zn-finger protein
MKELLCPDCESVLEETIEYSEAHDDDVESRAGKKTLWCPKCERTVFLNKSESGSLDDFLTKI